MNVVKTILATSLACIAFPAGTLSQTSLIDRGKQLTEQVAKCQDCHTPRTAAGELDKTAWLRGVPVDPVADPVRSASGKPQVHIPDITAEGTLWMLWGEKGMLRFLEKGSSPSGTTPSSHMPTYKMRHDDAEAVVAYLKSLRRSVPPATPGPGPRR